MTKCNIFLKSFFILITWVMIATSTNAQKVDSLAFQLKYNDVECTYDAYIIITKGYATNAFYRTQFSSQYTLVTPMGVYVTIEENFMPLKNNQNYTGTVPTTWSIGDSQGNHPDFPGKIVYSVIPSLSPSSQYNNLAVGDTIKIFSFSLNTNISCGQEIRTYNNDTDPPIINGSDYKNTFNIGGGSSKYQYSVPTVSPTPPTIDTFAATTSNDTLTLDLDLINPSCQGTMTCTWTKPNNTTFEGEDLIIPNPDLFDYGMYKVVYNDQWECIDSTEFMVMPPQINEITVENVITTNTFENIGIHIDILNDDNLNASCVVEYKMNGEATFKPSSSVMRAHPTLIVDGEPLDKNFFATSCLHLMPNTKYDIKITITDPDSGSEIIEYTTITKAFPSVHSNPQYKYAIPGQSGGDGSEANPYQGLQNAINQLVPGDILEVGPGSYTSATITNGGTPALPIIIRSSVLHQAIIDGNNTNTGILTIGSATDSIRHITIDGFDINDGHWGIDAQNTSYVNLINNKIHDIDYGIVNRRENGWEHDQYIHNNEIIGRTSWPQTNGTIPAERGIDVRGNVNVISHNTIKNFGDGISTDGPPYQACYAMDIHHNDITKVVDDLIEIDGIVSNARVYNNRCLNGRSGVSLAPIFGGPAYIFRNEFFNIENSTFKMNRAPSGLVIINNTSITSGDGMSSPSGWQNTIFKNNLIMSTQYIYQEYGLIANSIDLWANNGYFSTRAGTTAEPWFKWDNIKYDDVADIISNGFTEQNSITTAISELTLVTIPTTYNSEILPIDFDLTPLTGTSISSGGEVLPNISSPYLQDNTIAIGAREIGVSINYGHDFGNICNREASTLYTWDSANSNAWHHPYNWIPCGVPNAESEVIIPTSLMSYPTLNTDVIINKLSIYEGATLNIQGNGTQFNIKE